MCSFMRVFTVLKNLGAVKKDIVLLTPIKHLGTDLKLVEPRKKAKAQSIENRKSKKIGKERILQMFRCDKDLKRGV